LLGISRMIEPQPMHQGRKVKVADESIFVFELIADGGSRPASFHVIALVLESRAIDVGERMKRKIEDACGIGEGIEIRAYMVVLESEKTVLPTGRTVD